MPHMFVLDWALYSQVNFVLELQDKLKMKDIVGANKANGQAPGLDTLLYSADADFSCFADLALTSPGDYYKPNEGSLMQCVLTPGTWSLTL